MKSIITTTIIILAVAGNLFSSNYEETMKTNIVKMYQLHDVNELVDLANRFARVAQSEKGEWLPAYYAAYCFVRSTFFGDMDAAQKHQQLDQAQSIMDVLKKRAANQSEVFALQAFIYQLRITDMSKGYKYSKLASETLRQAEKLNPKNPRVFYLRGTNKYHTPKFFGGGAEKAKPFFEKAADLFESEKPANDLMPTWGAVHNQQLLAKCSGE